MGSDDWPSGDEIQTMYDNAKDAGAPVWEGPEQIWCSICRNPFPSKDIAYCTNCYGNFCPGCRQGRFEGERCIGPCSYGNPYNP